MQRLLALGVVMFPSEGEHSDRAHQRRDEHDRNHSQESCTTCVRHRYERDHEIGKYQYSRKRWQVRANSEAKQQKASALVSARRVFR